MDLQVQAKLLKVLEEKRFRRVGAVRDCVVDVRLIAATHQDLGSLAERKSFRTDLYFRINALPLTVPPLRERGKDIPVLARHLLERFGPHLGRGVFKLEPDAIEALQAYPWPGNIRELRNVLERAVLLSEGPAIGSRDLSFGTASAGALPAAAPRESESNLTLLEVERRHVRKVLREEGGHVGRAARRLGIPRSSLYDKIKKHGIRLSEP